MRKLVLRIWGRLRIYQKLSAGFLIMTVLPLLLVNAIALKETERELKRSVSEHFQLLAINLADDLDKSMNEKVRLLRVLAGNPQVRGMRGKEVATAISNAVGQYPELAIVIVTDAKGKMIARSDGLPANIDYADRDYFKKVVKTGTTAFSKMIVSRSTGKHVISIAEPVRGSGGQLAGMLVADYDVGDIVSRLSAIFPGREGEVFVADGDGIVLIHQGGAWASDLGGRAAPPVLGDAIHGKNGWDVQRETLWRCPAGTCRAQASRGCATRIRIASQPVDRLPAGCDAGG